MIYVNAGDRVGDRATNLAEAIQFISNGDLVEQERPKADTTRSIVIEPARPVDAA